MHESNDVTTCHYNACDVSCLYWAVFLHQVFLVGVFEVAEYSPSKINPPSLSRCKVMIFSMLNCHTMELIVCNLAILPKLHLCSVPGTQTEVRQL